MAYILVIGDGRERTHGLRSLLRQDGHRITVLHDTAGWREVERLTTPEVVVAAVASPDRVLAPGIPPVRGFPAPLLFVQHEGDVHRDIVIDERVVDHIESPFMAEEFVAHVDALVRVRRVVRREALDEPASRDARRDLRAIGGGIAAFLGTRLPRYDKPQGPYLEVAARVAEWADRRDGFEPGHAERVASFAAMMADGLRLSDGETATLLRAAMLHDIGKVALPVEVLRREGPLAEDQMRLVRTHTARGARLMRALDDDPGIAEAILNHHERVDGLGYNGLKGDAIPLAARILAVAETYDAMTTTRVGTPVPNDRALTYLRERRGRDFDPDCVDALVLALRPSRSTIPLSRV